MRRFIPEFWGRRKAKQDNVTQKPVKKENKQVLLVGTNRCIIQPYFNENGFADAIYISESAPARFCLKKLRCLRKNGLYYFAGGPNGEDISVEEAVKDNKWLANSLLVFGVQLPTLHEERRGANFMQACLAALKKAGHSNLANEIVAKIKKEEQEAKEALELELPMLRARQAEEKLQKRMETIEQIKATALQVEFVSLAKAALFLFKQDENEKVDKSFSAQCHLFLLLASGEQLTDAEYIEVLGVSKVELEYLSKKWH